MKKTSQGFTLVELLIVMAIISVLAAFMYANFAGARERARDARRKSDLDQLKKSLRLYYNDFQKYPTAIGNNNEGLFNGCGDTGTGACSKGGVFNFGTTIYMNSLPTDPQSTTKIYTYYQGSNTDSFVLSAQLENASDPDIAKSQSRCGGIYGGSEHDGTLYLVCSE